MTFKQALGRCEALGGSEQLLDTLRGAEATFKSDEPFEQDEWNVVAYLERKLNARRVNLKFGKFENGELKVFAKLFILYLSTQETEIRTKVCILQKYRQEPS